MRKTKVDKNPARHIAAVVLDARNHGTLTVVIAAVAALLAVSSFSCRQTVAYDNPLDPSSNLLPPSDLAITSFNTGFVDLTWKENNAILSQAQRDEVTSILEMSTDSISFDTLAVKIGEPSDIYRSPAIEGDGIFDKQVTYYFRLVEIIGTRYAGMTNVVSGRPY